MDKSIQQERLRQFDQQFEFQVAMIMEGIVPHSGTSPDFIIKTLERLNYDPDRIEQMKQLLPLLKEEVEYLNTKERYEHLHAKREDRHKQLKNFIRGFPAI